MEESLQCLHSFAKDFDEHASHRQFTPDVIALVTGLVEGLAEHALPEGVEYHPATEQEPFYWLQFPLLHALDNQCLLMTPVEHAEEAFEQLIPVWEASGCTTRDERRQRAWQWWKEENHKADFEGGKLWKHVESLDGSMHARAIPAHKMASALTGALCGTRAFITCFEYSMFSDGYAQVACHMEKDMRTDDENHPYYDPHSTEKTDWAQEMVRDHMASTSDRMLAERFAPSAANFGLMYAEMHRVDLRAADPAKVARLMSHCRNPGGAGFWDMTAQRWQKDDTTFKATGSSEGRIIWSAIESTDGL